MVRHPKCMQLTVRNLPYNQGMFDIYNRILHMIKYIFILVSLHLRCKNVSKIYKLLC